MATISSIGTAGRTYSTPASWLTFFAAGGWEGELYNDTQFTAAVSFSGQATSATDYIILRCATGQGWRDNASVQTNAYAFNASAGVSFSVAGTVCTIAENFVTVSGLQFACTSAAIALVNNTISLTNAIVENCIVESASSTNAAVQWRSGTLRNTLIVKRSSGAVAGISIPSGATSPVIASCTIVRPSPTFTVGSNAIAGPATGTITIINCAGFGFTNFAATGGATLTGSNNCSDVAITFGTSNQASKTYASQFAVIADTGRDFKALVGGDLIDTGVTDTTNVPSATDAPGTSRPQGSAWDIGAWELVTASGVSVSLTGQGMTGGQGVLTRVASKTLAGQAMTVGQGTPTLNINALLTGQGMTAGQGALPFGSVNVNYDITRAYESTGFEPTAFYDNQPMQMGVGQGTLSLAAAKSISGQGATAGQGSITKVVSPVLTGQAMAAGQGSISKTIAKALTGQGATAGQGATIYRVAISIVSDPMTAGQGQFGSVTSPRFNDSAVMIVRYEPRWLVPPAQLREMTVLAEQNVIYVLEGDSTAPPLRG